MRMFLVLCMLAAQTLGAEDTTWTSYGGGT